MKALSGNFYWVTADITADASALLRTQVMGEMNHQDNQAQRGNLKKRKEGKKKSKIQQELFAKLYNRKDEKEQNIRSVLYNLWHLHKHKDKIVTYSDKDCSLKKKRMPTLKDIWLSFIFFILQKTQATCLQSKPKGNWGICWGKNILFLFWLFGLSMALALTRAYLTVSQKNFLVT